MSRIFRIIVSVKVVVVCVVVRLPWQRVFASEGVLLSESSVVTCESRPLYLSLSLRAWDCVASARRGLPLGRKIYFILTSYFFPIPDNRPATAFYRERRHSEAPRGIMPTSCHDGSGTILSGLMCCTFLYAAKVRKFFFLRRVRRSQQLPAAISCRPKLSPRREKKADVSVQSRGQMDGRHCGVCGNRIYSAAAI